MAKIQELIESADNAYYAAEYDKAIELFKQALVLSPKNKHAQQYLRKTEETKKLIENADDAYYAAEYDKAIQLYKQVLDSDPNNKHAQEQLKKSERNRLSKSAKPETVPTEALRLYKRSRSFITVGDLVGAKKLLKQAIDIANEINVNFHSAEYLLGNIQNALKAEEYKKKAFEDIDTQQWVKAEANLNFAVDLDPTDDTIQTLLLHLRKLLTAQNLIRGLMVGTRNRSSVIKEIREIINLTNQTTALSKLWQEVVVLFGEYNRYSISPDITRVIFVLLILAGLLGGVSASIGWFIGVDIAVILLGVALILFVSTIIPGIFKR
jgi:tetratricopeptide (TPR) repeat protein